MDYVQSTYISLLCFLTVVPMFDAMTACQELHPDPEDEDSGEEYGNWATTQQNSYSISHLLDTVTT